MTTNPPEGTPDPGAYPPPDSPTPPPYQAPAYGQTPPPAYGQTPPPAYGQTPPPGYGPTPPPYGQPVYAAPLSPSDERLWATLAHLSGILSIIATFVIYIVYKDRGPFVRDQVTEALNFQITAWIAGFVGGIVIAILAAVTAGIGAILWLAFLAVPVFMVLGALAANRGEAYRYPFNWRVIK